MLDVGIERTSIRRTLGKFQLRGTYKLRINHREAVAKDFNIIEDHWQLYTDVNISEEAKCIT